MIYEQEWKWETKYKVSDDETLKSLKLKTNWKTSDSRFHIHMTAVDGN